MLHKVSEVTYEIEILEDSRVHNVFHVSRLKKAIGQQIVPFADLLPLDKEGKLVLVPEAILDTRERTLRNRVVKEYLVKWRNLPKEDTTWKKSKYYSITN